MKLNIKARVSNAMRAFRASAKTLTLTEVSEWAEIFRHTKSASGKFVDAKTALRSSGTLACIRILMEDVAAPPLILKKTTPSGPTDAIDHPLYRLLKTSPNEYQTSVDLREHLMMDALLHGRWANWVQRDGSGKVLSISPLNVSGLSWAGLNKAGEPVWQYASQYLSRSFTHNDLWRGSIMSNTTFEGQSLILLAREAIGLAMAAEEQGARLFTNGIQSDLVIENPNEDSLSKEEKLQLKEALNDAYSGSENAFRALLLEGGLKAHRIGLTAVESQFLEARNYQLADVARIFRIPSVMLGIVGDKANTYASTEQFFLSYEKHCLRPWCNRIEQTISRDLILPGEFEKDGYFAKHDLTDLLRADMKTRFDAYAVGINAGFVKLNEPRQWEGWQTDPKLNIFLRQGAMVEIGKDPVPVPVPAPAIPSPEPKSPEPKSPDPKPRQDTSTRLALMTAASVVSTERKWFDRQDKGEVTDSQRAGFVDWHFNKVSAHTGARDADILAYCDWRAANRGKESDAEAQTRLVKLCLKGDEQ
jgi:HK97 family phage portal protein